MAVTTLEDVVAAIDRLQEGQAELQKSLTMTSKQLSDVIILLRGNPDLGATGIVPRLVAIENFVDGHSRYHDKIENRAMGAIWMARAALALGGSAVLAILAKLVESLR
jgi:hypothetical protein